MNRLVNVKLDKLFILLGHSDEGMYAGMGRLLSQRAAALIEEDQFTTTLV